MALVSQGQTGAYAARHPRELDLRPAEALITEYSYKYTPEAFGGPGGSDRLAGRARRWSVRPVRSTLHLLTKDLAMSRRPEHNRQACAGGGGGADRPASKRLLPPGLRSITAPGSGEGAIAPAHPSYCCGFARKRRSRRLQGKRSGSADPRAPGNETTIWIGQSQDDLSPMQQQLGSNQLKAQLDRQLEAFLGFSPGSSRCCFELEERQERRGA